MRVLVVGGGVAGITATKACLEENLDVVCYERDENSGGIWWYREKSGDSTTVMKVTVANTSKELSAFSDFPPDITLPAYLTHENTLKYYRDYADHFGVSKHIKFNQEVLQIKPAEGEGEDQTGKWLVRSKATHTKEEKVEVFDAVMICVGQHTKPKEIKDLNVEEFSGKIIHAKEYKKPDEFQGKRVVVVGLGNSAADVATNLVGVASKVILSVRRGSWIFPRQVRGIPLDQAFIGRFRTKISQIMPRFIFKRLIISEVRKIFDIRHFGLEPSYLPGTNRTVVSDALPSEFLAGNVELRRQIKCFTTNGVIFENCDIEEKVDAIIFAIGYDIVVPFIDETYFPTSMNGQILLYKGIYPPSGTPFNTLGYIGLFGAGGSITNVFELQARHFVQNLIGKVTLPNSTRMMDCIEKNVKKQKRTYLVSEEEPFNFNEKISYMDDLAKDFGASPPSFLWLLFQDPRLAYHYWFGPFLAYHYRLVGPHANWNETRKNILEAMHRQLASVGIQ